MKLPDKKGFTLLEVLVSLSILAIGLIAVVRSFSGTLQAGDFSRELTGAYLLAEGKISELETTPQDILGIKRGDFGKDHPGYRWETEVNSTGNPDIQEATVRVFWQEREKEERVELVTLLQTKPLSERIQR